VDTRRAWKGKALRLPVAHRDREHAARPVSGLSNWNAGVPAHRLPESRDSVAFDALGFDYRCGGSAGFAVLAAHQLPV